MQEKEKSAQQLLSRIKELEGRLEESEQLIEAIKAGEVDAFAINNQNEAEVYTLQSGDYAYRVLVEEFGEGAINVTEDGLIVYTNRYFFELLKLPYEKVIGTSVFDFIHPDSIQEFKSLFDQSFSKQSKGEINLKIKDGLVPTYVSLTSLQPKLPTVGIIITDLTEKKKNEKTIFDYQADLENKNLKLLQSNAELDSFAYIASHDLQEPLRKIQTFADRILENKTNDLSETGKDHFNRIQAATRRMRDLIDDLLTYSHTNTIEREFEETDLAGIIEEVKLDLKEELQQKNVIIDVGKLDKIRVVPFQFRQLVHNLISNSLKFSRSGKEPHIKISSRIDAGTQFNNEKLTDKTNYCHISFSDDGIGFEQQYSDRIFQLFQRLHGKTEYSGTGIGLAIVKKIVANHNGIITATGEPGSGATFDIYIPIQ